MARTKTQPKQINNKNAADNYENKNQNSEIVYK